MYCCIKDKRRLDKYDRDLESVDRIMDIREMIKNGGNLSVLSNVFLKDYQIKLIPHLDTDDKDENEKAALLSDQEALDILYKGKRDGNEYQKAVDAYLIRHIDDDFLHKFGDESKIEDYQNNRPPVLMETHGPGLAARNRNPPPRQTEGNNLTESIILSQKSNEVPRGDKAKVK